MRRYLMQVLPTGLPQARHFGWAHPRAGATWRHVETTLDVEIVVGTQDEPIQWP